MMFSRTIVVGLLAGGCLAAAGAGALVATRQNHEAAVEISAPQAAPAAAANQGPQPVAETETVVQPKAAPATAPAPAKVEKPAPVEAPPRPIERKSSPSAPPVNAPRHTAAAAPSPAPGTPAPAAAHRAPDERPAVESRTADPRPPEPKAAAAEPARENSAPIPPVEAMPRPDPPTPPKPAERQFEELVLPTSSVIGLEVETSLTSERAQVEDRVDARVTRDVYVDGRLVIPSRSRMIGAVTMVERGGKVKERARLGVRFHTLVLDDGRQIALRTETIVREGEPPSGDSSRKIGGAAIGGAVLGAIIGGGKGAVLGGAAGAAGGTAAVMAGGRNAATLTTGTVVTARLAAPVSVEVEKR